MGPDTSIGTGLISDGGPSLGPRGLFSCNCIVFFMKGGLDAAECPGAIRQSQKYRSEEPCKGKYCIPL